MDLALKKCSKCGIRKDIDEFYGDKKAKDGLCHRCKNCCRKWGKKYHCQNSKKLNKQSRKYYQENKEEKCKQQGMYYQENKEKISKQKRECRQQNPKEACRKERKYSKKRRQNPQFRLSHNISGLIRYSLKGNKNGMHWENINGYTLQSLIEDMESKFMNGINWNNYGRYGWVIHHKIPISLWKFESYDDREFKQCWALCNLEPMWDEENLRKGNRIS